MGGYLNPFRIAGDVSHALSKLILMVAIHRNRSAEGVSWITQVLYVVVFFTRYTDIWIPEEHRSSSFLTTWNWLFKIYYMISSLYIVGIMRWLFPRTREREVAWKLGAIIFFGTLIISPFVFWIFPTNFEKTFGAWLWNWSQILESVCVLPQLLLLRQTTVPTVIDSFYLVTLGSYRALYIPNWIWRWAKSGKSGDHGPEVVSVVFGIIQTALYVDFAWVYWTRQRVKLRNGGIVDADDMGRGWLVNRLLGRQDDRAPGDEERAPALGGRPRPRSKWGARGISVSADDGILDGQEEGLVEGPVDPDATMRDPEELARALQDSSDEEEEDDDEEEGDSEDGSVGPKKQTAGTAGGVTNGSEWRS